MSACFLRKNASLTELGGASTNTYFSSAVLANCTRDLVQSSPCATNGFVYVSFVTRICEGNWDIEDPVEGPACGGCDMAREKESR